MSSLTPINAKNSSLLAISPDMLRERLTAIQQPKYRADQILDWIYRKQVSSIDEMTNLSAELRKQLSEGCHLCESTIVCQAASSDGTQKLLLKWQDDATTECVLIPDGDRCTACISTQVGCPVGCVFCASGLDGLQRQLTPAQIVEQALCISRLCRESGRRLSNVVFMGLGEPLHNYDATVTAVRTINADWGMNIGARKITISTVGLPKQIKRLADESLQITLAISLHAPNDELRREIIPWAEGVDIASLIDAARYYFDRTGREVTLEYILLADLNDAPSHARELATVARKMRSNINLIRYNPVTDLPYRTPSTEAAHKFQSILRDKGLNTHMRKSRGTDIDAACGQLRRRHNQP